MEALIGLVALGFALALLAVPVVAGFLRSRPHGRGAGTWGQAAGPAGLGPLRRAG